MKAYMEVGERGYYDKKRYRCVPAVMGCFNCGLAVYARTKKILCPRVLCKRKERPDKLDVIFLLQPKYRKGVQE